MKSQEDREEGPLGRSRAKVHKLRGRGKLLHSAALRIVEDIPMAGKDILTAISELLKYLHHCEPHATKEFADQLIIMSGDFQQPSPIVVGGDGNACVGAWLTYST